MRSLFGQFALVERVFRVAERGVALLFRCQPKNARSEQTRLLAAWQRGNAASPHFVYDPVPDLSALREHLLAIDARLRPEGTLARLYAARARELALETRLVEAIATTAMPHVAAERFVPGDRRAERAALALARRWCGVVIASPEDPSALVASDDHSSPESLLRRMEEEVGRRRLAFRVELSDTMSAAAATGDGVILVARGRQLRRKDTERIVAHEVLGHALPRERARKDSQRLFALGSARGNDEQEGLALYLEREHSHLDHDRKRELGLRHLAAVSVHEGADWVDTTRHLLALGASVEEAILIATRVHRGGGLAREYIYLPALLRVSDAARDEPDIIDWLSRGRLSLDAVAALRSEELADIKTARS